MPVETITTTPTETQPVYIPTKSLRFVQIRPGLLEHLQTGRLTPREFTLMVSLIILADAATGVYRACSVSLAKKCGKGFNERGLQVLLHDLAEKGYIRRDRPNAAQRGNYPILIDKYQVTSGPKKGLYLWAAQSTDMSNLVYVNEDGVVSTNAQAGGSYEYGENPARDESLDQLYAVFEEATYNLHTDEDDDAAMQNLLTGTEDDHDFIISAAKWAVKEDFWKDKVKHPKNFVKFFKKGALRGQYEKYLDGQDEKARKKALKAEKASRNSKWVKQAHLKQKASKGTPAEPVRPRKLSFSFENIVEF
jgi:hypothetical protein